MKYLDSMLKCSKTEQICTFKCLDLIEKAFIILFCLAAVILTIVNILVLIENGFNFAKTKRLFFYLAALPWLVYIYVCLILTGYGIWEFI